MRWGSKFAAQVMAKAGHTCRFPRHRTSALGDVGQREVLVAGVDRFELPTSGRRCFAGLLEAWFEGSLMRRFNVPL